MMKIHPDQVQVGGSSSSSSSCTALAATSYIAEIIAPPAPLNGEEPSSSEGVVWHQNDQNIFNHNDVLSSHGALPDDSTAATRMKLNYAIIYSSAALGFYALWYTFHDIGLSTLLTFSVLIQSVALICLLAGVLCQRSVRGISAMSIGMQACSFCLRLGTTTFLRGYIPTDSTGDYLYQLADLFALTLCVYIVYLAKVRFAHTYQRQADSFPVAPTLVGCIIAAIMIHPDLNNCPFFDALWAASLYTDVMSTMPQLWMINRLAGKFDALSAHYVFLVALSRTLETIFWSHGYTELAPENGVDLNISGFAVLGANLLHIVLMADFVYMYLRNWYKGNMLRAQFDFSGESCLDVV